MSSNVVGEASVRIRPETSGFARDAEAQIGGRLRQSGRRLATQLGVGFAAAKLATSTFAAVTGAEQGLANVGSVAEATNKQLGQLARQSQETGRALGFGAREGLQAQFELAKAGVTVEDTLGGAFEGTLALAAAGELELGQAATFAANAMKTFGLEGRDVTGIADAFATAANQTTADVADFGVALSQGGSVAKQAGLNFTETVAILESLADIGVKNSDAGTSLRTTILQLLNPTKQQAALAKRVGLNVVDQNGALKDGAGIAAELVKVTQGLNRAQRTQLFAQLAGADGVRTLNALYEAGPAKLRRYEQGLERQGSAAETARKRQQSLRGDLDKLGASFETLQIRAASATSGVARQATQELTRLVDRVADSPELQRGAAAVGEGVLDALNDPSNQASAKQLGTTVVDVFGAIRQSAEAAAPAVSLVANAFSAAAATPLGPQILLTAAGFKLLNRGVAGAEGPLARLRAVQQANAAAAVAQRAAVTQSVSAIGLVGPSSAKAAAGVAKGTGALRTFAGGLSAIAGGPATLAVAGIATVAAGAFLLANRESFAEGQARRFNEALREQAAAADLAAAALDRQRSAATNIAQGRVNIDQARAGVTAARDRVQEVERTPAADLGGEAAKTAALAAAKNALRLAEQQLNDARRAGAQTAREAIAASNQEQAASAKAAGDAARATRESGATAETFARALTLLPAAALKYTRAVTQQSRAEAQSASNLDASAAAARRAAGAVDTSTAAGRRYAAQLRAEAAQSTAAAQATRRKAVATAQQALEANKAVASSKNVSAAERRAAADRVKALEGLIAQLRAQGRRAGQASAEGTAQGARSKKGEVEKAGREGGEAVADGAAATAPEANAAGQSVGVALGQGIATGITSQSGSVANVARGLVQAAEAAARAEAQTGSPSKLFAKVGRDMGAGVTVGVQGEQARTAGAATGLVTRAVAAAGQVGVRNARTQGARILGAVAEGFRVGGGGFRATITTTISSALRDSVQTAQSNLTGFGSTLADLAGRAVEARAPDFTPQRRALTQRGAALDAASAADEERRLRNSVALAEAGGDAAAKRYAALQASAARRTPEQDARLTPLARERERQRLEEARLAAEDPARQQRLELERFLLSQDESRVAAAEAAAQEETAAQRAALDRQIADQVANLNARRITFKEFSDSIPGILAANGVDIAAAGATLGTAFADQFGLALTQIRTQARNVANAPGLPSGFVPGVEAPAEVAKQEFAQTRAVLRTAFQTELARVRDNQRAQTDRLRTAFQEEGSEGGRRIVASEQRQLTAKAAADRALLKKLGDLQAAFLAQPPATVIESLVVGAPGSDPQVVGDAIARAITRNNARGARR